MSDMKLIMEGWRQYNTTDEQYEEVVDGIVEDFASQIEDDLEAITEDYCNKFSNQIENLFQRRQCDLHPTDQLITVSFLPQHSGDGGVP